MKAVERTKIMLMSFGEDAFQSLCRDAMRELSQKKLSRLHPCTFTFRFSLT